MHRWQGVQTDLRRTTATTVVGITTLTASATPHTKGSWGTLITSTAIESAEAQLTIGAMAGTGVDSSCLMDLAIGPSGSPIMLIDNLNIGWGVNSEEVEQHFRLPFRIPAGVEIIGRIQATTASRTADVSLDLYGGTAGDSSRLAFTKCTTYGAVTASSRGTILAAPAGDNVDGAWTVIDASTAAVIRAFSFGLGFGNDTGVIAADFLVDIGVGGAGVEAVVCADIRLHSTTSEGLGEVHPEGRFYPIGVNLPAGSRIVGRYRHSAAQGLDLMLYGWS
jgi:hypothetical protein